MMVDKAFEERLYNACVEAGRRLGDRIKGMSCFLRNWKMPPPSADDGWRVVHPGEHRIQVRGKDAGIVLQRYGDDGWFFASVPGVKGLVSFGPTDHDALGRLFVAARLMDEEDGRG